MACCGTKELVSFFFYKICNPKRSDYEIEEHVEEVDELRAEAEEFDRSKTISQVEAEELNRSKAISENNSGPLEENANEELFYLPSDLVLAILSSLALKENIRASAVCKTWGKLAASVRVRDPPCWLMYLDKFRVGGVSFGFYDPIEKKKTKAMYLPELSESSCIRCSNDGWLLVEDSPSPVNLFFFNPFTWDRINLPKFMVMLSSFAFSCAPTKKGCLVFGINIGVSSSSVTISTWHSGAATWVYEKFPPLLSYAGHTRNILYSDGLFYVSTELALGVFDPTARTWNILPQHPIPEICMCIWMTGYKGQIFRVDATSSQLMVFRLNRLESVWEKKETLDGSSIFVSDESCVMVSGLTRSMSNIVYVWDGDINMRRPSKYECYFKFNRPYKYSLYSRSLCEDPDGFYFEDQTTYHKPSVWIEPPHNISIFDFPILDASDAINT